MAEKPSLFPPSSSSSSSSFSYDVYISYRGGDTRYYITGNLHKALRDKGIRTFTDEALQMGDEIGSSLQKAIQESRTAIIVFSKSYASSKFCLDELVWIMDCFKGDDRLVFPVFYDVKPSEVRYQRGSYGEAMAMHKKRYNDNMEKVQRWSQALHQAASLEGFDYSNRVGYENVLIENIVEKISKIILRSSLLHVADYPVGLESRVLEVNSLLNYGFHDGVRMVGIYGTGGIGKTTLARAVFNFIADRFEGSCFLENVRETSKKIGLECLQEELLHKILGDKDIKLSSANEGIPIIKHRLGNRKILLVLDDVDELEQLKALAGRPDWFGYGSRVIITTRNKDLLASHGIERKYKVQGLNEKDALALLAWNAFEDENIDPSYKDILKQAITYARGIPLALEAIGSLLFGKNIKEWRSLLAVFDEYERIHEENIQEELKISFYGLQEHQKKIFLKGPQFSEEIPATISILLGSGFHKLERTITVLWNCVTMIHKIELFWRGKKFLQNLLSIDLSASCNLKETPDLSGVPFLKELNLNHCKHLTEVHPSLVHHKKLFYLNLMGCKRLKTLPGKLEMSSLETLILKGCKSFDNLPEFGECMGHLSELSLGGTAIEKLPTSFQSLVGLKSLDIRGCKILDGSLFHVIHRLKYRNEDFKAASAAGEASSSSPASTPFPTLRSWTSHVFLSFNREDTHNGFIDYLCEALTAKGIRTLRDDNGLAIKESMFAIIVLSPNYASSTWCLDELQTIVKCNVMLGLEVIPVFYGVEPSDLWHQTGSFEEPFRKHHVRFGKDRFMVGRWRSDLRRVADHFGGYYYKDQTQIKIVESLVRQIHKKLIIKSPPWRLNLVGIDSRVKEVIRLIAAEFNDVRFVGIWGMGGIGKTTIAREVFEIIKGEYEVHYFVSNVREIYKTKGFDHLQGDILSHLNTRSDFYSYHIEDEEISVCDKKVLLVLDDVSEINQLENLAGKQDWFGPGSRIIITTTDIDLLEKYGMHEIYEVERMAQDEALHLFCLNAFKRDQPEEGYSNLSKDVIKYTSCHPLALKLLGSYLYGRPVDVWASTVREIEMNQSFEIFETLKLSYEGLDSKEKDIFLDIACFFKGMNIDDVTDILEKSSGENPITKINVLLERSLVTINHENKELEMHDLLQEMGRNIVIEESRNDPGKRNRLWSKEDINLVLTEKKGTSTIQGIVHSSGGDACWSPEAFSDMSQLKVLLVQGGELPFGPNCLPRPLKVLHWWRYPLKTLPLPETHYDFAGIELKFSKIEHLWDGIKLLGNLKYLDLSHSWYLRQTPDLSEAPFLEKLVLEDCSDLTEVHPSIMQHNNLVLLNLSKCIRLRTLPGEFRMCSLRELILEDCWSLENLPEFGECMEHLSRLSLEGSAIRVLPKSLGRLVCFFYLNLDHCNRLVCFPYTIHGMDSLKIPNASDKNFKGEGLCGILQLPRSLSGLGSLDLSYCGLTEESLPHEFFHLPSLTHFYLNGNNFVSLPKCIRGLPRLECLKLNGCKKLQFLPELPSSLRQLEACNCPSLDTSEFNPFSRAHNIFASFNQGAYGDHGQVMKMLISGIKIPSWFVHKEEGNSVSAPQPQHWRLRELMGIVLCFKLHFHDSPLGAVSSLVVHNGVELRDSTFTIHTLQGYQLYILYLTHYSFNEGLHPGHHFELLTSGVNDDGVRVLSSAACWVHREYI